MYALIGFAGLIGFFVFIILIIVSAIKKEKRISNVAGLVICIVLFFSGVALTPSKESAGNVGDDTSPPESTILEQIENDNRNSDGSSPQETTDLKDLGQITTIQIEPEPTQEPITQEERERVLKVDAAIWDRVLSAEENYNNLLATMENSDSLYSVFSFCESLESLMDSYSSDVNRISDEKGNEYIQSAGVYFYQIGNIANHVKKYANSSDMNELSKAQDGILLLNELISNIVASRFEYLSSCGFSDEEIIEIGNTETD